MSIRRTGWNDEPGDFETPQAGPTQEEIQRQIDEATKETIERLGLRGSLGRVSSGGATVTQGLGFSASDDGTPKTQIKPNGNVFIGSDLNTPSGVTFSVFVSAEDFNAEDMGAGDLMIGNNSDTTANLKWDQSEGQLLFRLGQTVTAYMDADGTLNFSSGTIGGWTIDDTRIFDAEPVGISLNSTDSMIQVGDVTGTHIQIDGANKRIRSSNFATGATGFNINAATGDAEFNNITARGELKTFLLTSSNQMAVGGNIIVSKDAGKLGADVSSGATTVNFGKALTVGNWIKIQGPDATGSNALEWMLIGSLVSGTTYNVTRNVDGSGANAWLKDTPFVVIGASGDSRIELIAGASGSIQLITQGAAWNTQTVQASMSTVAGAITAGGGDIKLDDLGLLIQNSTTSGLHFADDAGNRDTIHIVADANNDFEFVNIAETPAGTTSFFLKIGGVTRRVFHLSGTGIAFNEGTDDVDFRIGSNTNQEFFKIDAGTETLTIAGATGITGNAAVTGDTTLNGNVSINTSLADKDFKVSTDTNAYTFIVDGGNNRVEIGRDDGGRTAVHIIDPASTTYFNEPNYDIDFVVEGAIDETLLYVDAGNDRVGIGTDIPAAKLDVLGDLHVSNSTDSVHIIGTSGSVIFNFPGDDIDFNARGTTDDSLFYINASDNCVGIGNAGASGHKLTVQGKTRLDGALDWNTSSANVDAGFYGDTGVAVLYIDGNGAGGAGAVGVATSSPGSKLDVAGSFQCDTITNDTGLAAGTYSPTCTVVANADSTSAVTDFTYMRVGNSVMVSGNLNVDATVISTLTRVRVSLPIASDLTNAGDLTGTGGIQGSDDVVIAIGDITNNAAEINYTANGTANTVIRILFMYVVK
jgi:hypothetical protein